MEKITNKHKKQENLQEIQFDVNFKLKYVVGNGHRKSQCNYLGPH